MARAKEWRQEFLGFPMPVTDTAFNQTDMVLIDIPLDWTLIRTRVDINITNRVLNTGSTLNYDPTYPAFVQMWFGTLLIDEDISTFPPALNDSGGSTAIDWVTWDVLTPRVEFAPTIENGLSMLTSWTCNGGVTLESFARRGPMVGATPQLWASFAVIDGLGLISGSNPGFWSAETSVQAGFHCLFETAPM